MDAAEVSELLEATIARLRAAGVPVETLAVLKHSRGVLGLGASDSLVPVGHAWRLGVLLLGHDGSLYATGEVTRAVQPGRAAVNRSAAGEKRRAIRAMAARGNFPRGEVVNYDWQPIALDAASLSSGTQRVSIENGAVFVRFGDGELSTAPLERYLDDRVRILLED
jgi:hypothetical protein